MAYSLPIRLTTPHALRAMMAASCLLGSPAMLLGQSQAVRPRPNFQQHAPSSLQHPERPQQEHLAQWMERHRNLSLAQQQSALEKEPGFRDFPEQTQQRMRDRLTQLNTMPPQQRQRLLERTEAMEQLTPQQRQQVRAAYQQLSSLPVDRRRLVARAFRDIRELPVAQREVVLNSERFRNQFSDVERGTLANLLTVEPYLPVQHALELPEYNR